MRTQSRTCGRARRRVLLVVYCLAPFAILLSLGTWQLLRLREKLHVIETMHMNPVILPAGDLRTYAYRTVKLQGAFQGTKHIRVFAGKMGYYFLQPFSLVDGRHILVNRGVFAGAALDNTHGAGAQPASGIGTAPGTHDADVRSATGAGIIPGDVRDADVRAVSGVLHCKLRSLSRWIVRNNPKENLWFWFDINDMSEYVGLPDLEPCILWGDHTTVAGRLSANPALKIRNDHLEYTITWYSLALIWCLGYVYRIYRAR